jgi:hypothetical protein
VQGSCRFGLRRLREEILGSGKLREVLGGYENIQSCFFPLRKWSARKFGSPRSSVAVSSPSMIAERTGSAATAAAIAGRRFV